MKVPFAVIAFVLLSSYFDLILGWSACECYEYSITDILDKSVRSSSLSLIRAGQTCPVKTRYVLNYLSNEVKEVKPSAEHYTSLVDKIKAKSSDLGIPNEGLITGRTRLMELLNYYEDRHATKIAQIIRLRNRAEKCKGSGSTIEQNMERLKQAHVEQISRISELQKYLNCLKTKKKMLQALLNQNSAALHGSSGMVTGTLEDVISCSPPENVNLLKLSDNSELAN